MRSTVISPCPALAVAPLAGLSPVVVLVVVLVAVLVLVLLVASLLLLPLLLLTAPLPTRAALPPFGSAVAVLAVARSALVRATGGGEGGAVFFRSSRSGPTSDRT